MRQLTVIGFAVVVSVGLASGAGPANLVANGSFEIDADGDGVPDGWQTSGHPSIKQAIVSEAGREGGRCARLACTHFDGESGWHHVMICQVGVVGVKRGQWYRVRFWAKGSTPAVRAGSVALSNTKTWRPTGLSGAFAPRARWKRFEFVFQATSEVPAAQSRLQFWFSGVGSLWLDDVEVTPVDLKRTWHPQVPAECVTNVIPNSSFECGPAGWGSVTRQRGPWGASLYRLIGDLDPSTASHGRHSLKIRLTSDRLPRLYFDYYEPYAEPVRSVLAANCGWFKVRKDRPYVLSAFLRAEKPGTVAILGAVIASGGFASTTVNVGTQWRRYEFPFHPWAEFLHIAVGLDLEASKMRTATLWIDGVQLETGRKATDYRPRRPVEAFAGTSALGNIFTSPEKGLDVRVRAFNDTDTAATIEGTVTLTDFLDRETLKQSVALRVPPGGAERRLPGLAAGQRGFFRLHWRYRVGDDSDTQSLRCAVIDPFTGSDSRLGMNHAYPNQFLITLARQAGILWWRDWSVKWQTVEPTPGAFDFRAPDVQIDRVRKVGGRVLLLFPFPSSVWASSGDAKRIAAAAGGSQYLKRRLPTAFAARRMADFERYVRQSVRHYRGRITHYQVLNEPLYTTYALPKRFGYTMADYLDHVKAVHRAAKAEQPACVIVGGIGCSPAAAQAKAFVEAGGLKWVDAVDIHVYAAPGLFDRLEESLRALRQQMARRKAVRPIWITEFGCYADDDPACRPARVGDQTMQRCARSSELEASAAIVRLTAMFAAYGVEKVFFHAGTARAINQPDAGGVFFEYGGAPRKMVAAAAALARRLPPGSRFVEPDLLGPGFKSYTFRTPAGLCTVAWSADETERQLKLQPGVVALDLMGNRLAGGTVRVTEVPVYLTTTSNNPAAFTP